MKMRICPICNKNSKWEQNKYTITEDWVKYEKEVVFNKNMCKTCKQQVKSCVILSCSGCDSIAWVKEEVFIKRWLNYRKWEVIEIKQCPNCSKDEKYHFV